MQLDKFVKCSCGKKKKIFWIDKLDYKRGDVTFCVGISECQRCFIQQEHYSGNVEDIQRFLGYVEN
ncbi:MAG: hypothetical protein JKY69_03490 [Flavobacteriaceae bacterium]|nr:hypothetical protein [Flavobacteriaceae bacterium]